MTKLFNICRVKFKIENKVKDDTEELPVTARGSQIPRSGHSSSQGPNASAYTDTSKVARSMHTETDIRALSGASGLGLWTRALGHTSRAPLSGWLLGASTRWCRCLLRPLVWSSLLAIHPPGSRSATLQ
jgi:hypothetical protein